MLEGGDGHHITATLVGLGQPGEMGVSGTEANPQTLKWCFTGGVSGATKLLFLLEGWEAKGKLSYHRICTKADLVIGSRTKKSIRRNLKWIGGSARTKNPTCGRRHRLEAKAPNKHRNTWARSACSLPQLWSDTGENNPHPILLHFQEV